MGQDDGWYEYNLPALGLGAPFDDYVIQNPNMSSNFAATSNTWAGTVGAVKNKSSLIGIGHIKIVQYYWFAADFVGLLGDQNSKISQRLPNSLPAYLVSISLINRRIWREGPEVVLSCIYTAESMLLTLLCSTVRSL